MKVQLIGKKYHSNLEGLGFKPMLSCFFYQLSASDGSGGGEPTWKRLGEGGARGGGRPTG
jgi:hypothetical protein